MRHKQLDNYVTSKEKSGLLTDLVLKDADGVYQPHSKLTEAIKAFEDAAGQKKYSKLDMFYAIRFAESLETAADERLKKESLASDDGKRLKGIRNLYKDKKEDFIEIMEGFWVRKHK
jgi:hypothetical protein